MRNTNPLTAKVRFHLGDVVVTGSSIVYDNELDGVYYVFRVLDGWRDTPGTKGDVTPRPVGHGSWGSPQYFSERNLEIEGDIIVDGKDPLLMEDAIEKLMAAIPIGVDKPFVFHRFGREYHLMVRQGGKPTVNWDGQGQMKAEFNIQLVALDPRKLSGDGTRPTKSISTPPGTAGQINMVNAGRGPLPPHILTFRGCVNPRITVDGLPGEQWFEIDLTSGAPLVVDYDRKTVTRGGVNVFSTMRGDWIDLRDKANVFRFSAASYGTASSLTIESYDSER